MPVDAVYAPATCRRVAMWMAAIVCCVFIAGCHGPTKTVAAGHKMKMVKTKTAAIVKPHPVVVETGAQLWAENCVRCHNVPPPGDYDDAQWHIILFHMQQRANLTDLQRKKILKFLLSDNKQ